MKASPPIGGMIARVFFLLPMLRGFGAIKELEKPRPRRARAMSPGQGARRAVPGRPSPTPPAPTRTPSRVGSVPAERTAAPAVNATPEVAPPPWWRRRVEAEAAACCPNGISPPRGQRGWPGLDVAPGVDAAKKSIRFIAHRDIGGPDCAPASANARSGHGDHRHVARCLRICPGMAR
jgi:hypothetical protein